MRVLYLESVRHDVAESTARDHFPQPLSIAVPGPFLFFGDVPQELKMATEQVQLGVEFGTHGFDR